MIEYSVIIRTIGKAGEKYQQLLNSIARLCPKPKEIIVVLPEGCNKPGSSLGEEKYYFCKKGMVEQRLAGIEKCKTKYALITDDDICFPSDFVQKLYEPLRNGKYGLSVAPLIEFLPQSKKSVIADTVMASAVPTIFHKDRYNTVLRTTGYSYNKHIVKSEKEYCFTQSAPWTCFFANVDMLKDIHFEDEKWLDKNGYSSRDDTAMFYKAWLNGMKTVVCLHAAYDHLDARTSTNGKPVRTAYASGFNTIVFWHRFIYSQEKSPVKKVWCGICIHYYLFTHDLVGWIKSKRSIDAKESCYEYKKGYHSGKEWIRSVEYHTLPSVICRKQEH